MTVRVVDIELRFQNNYLLFHENQVTNLKHRHCKHMLQEIKCIKKPIQISRLKAFSS